MRLEFSLTIDDFRDANDANMVATARASDSLKIIALVWQMATFGIVVALVWSFDPWNPRRELTSDIVNFLVTPIVPWLSILAYILWYTLRSGRTEALVLNPWEVRSAGEARPVRRRLGMKVLVNGIFTLVMGAGAIVVPVYRRIKGTMDSADHLLYGVGMASLPWGIYLCWGAVLRVGEARRKIDMAWARQTQLHHPMTMQFTAEGVVHETALSRTELKWPYIPGSHETPRVFILYVSAMLFYIVPKRVFSSEADLVAFREIVKNLAGPGPMGFPVLPPSTQVPPT